ncbi:thioredoxin-like 3-2, chloroplastic [Nicotiana tabacum]|uniref:Thioredoxin-like 3-2, chloroplastic n=2 Tax=Nicotiana TaxID=4085 RepID=A0A1S3XY67_TOBAC|nr:PREDICTED: thioredoxin-like 3-2, chloroplastic isoform X1 [Nicotiana sylvestris]XP_016444794.1 PREDICTED: thioredoxin-like 3-2, chloroplastic [Nicotiana tabacum]
MSSSTQFSPVIQQLYPKKSNQSYISNFKCLKLMHVFPISVNCSKIHLKFRARAEVLENNREESSVQDLDNSPASVELQPISSEAQFDRVISEAQQIDESVVILWMATWCRKCIYLKPKLEKLAADYFPRTRFYCVDVNNVPHKLVVRAGITKMPTIQLWRDGNKQAEVIGGHKAYLVVTEVRDMIENEENNL